MSACGLIIDAAIRMIPSTVRSTSANTSAAAMRMTIISRASSHPSRRASCCGRPSVDFDRKPRLRTIEVEHIEPDRMLAAERRQIRRTGAQPAPQLASGADRLRRNRRALVIVSGGALNRSFPSCPLRHASHGPPPPLRRGGKRLYLLSASNTFCDARPLTAMPFFCSKSAIADLVLFPIAPSGWPTS
jgi:hypothetical protein